MGLIDQEKIIGKKMGKVRKNFSIDRKVSEDFKKICDEKSINMSKLIESLLKKFIEESKK